MPCVGQSSATTHQSVVNSAVYVQQRADSDPVPLSLCVSLDLRLHHEPLDYVGKAYIPANVL